MTLTFNFFGLNIYKKIPAWALLNLREGISGYLPPIYGVRKINGSMTSKLNGQGHVSCCVRLAKIF